MKDLVLYVKHSNWGMMGPGDWNNTEWKIYSDLSVKVKVSYNFSKGEEKKEEYNFNLKDKDYERILTEIETAKDNEIIVDGCDGSAWEYIQYENGNEIWKRDTGYIYGIKSFENIAKILEKLEN